MAVAVPVYFDYASSLCFIAGVIGDRLEAELDVVLDWRPVEIASQYPSWTKGALLDDDSRERIRRVANETGVSLVTPTRWMDSRPALLGAFFARDCGCFREYHRHVFQTAYAHGEDIGDASVIERIADASGLAPAEFRRALASQRHARQLADHLAEVQRFGVTGYPAFLLGQFPLTGIQPFDTMRLLFLRYLEQRAARSLH